MSTERPTAEPVGSARHAHDSAVFDARYRAISTRDRRFDGQFFTGVKSTGIYCRPSCPARTPKPENVAFYSTSAAAQEAGFRACKRCLPEATPGTPEWNIRHDVAARAMRLIGDGVVDREGIEGLSSRLGYSARQLQRTLVAELGAAPLALARARRAQTARALLVGTDLLLADVAHAAGFGSVRQFNETFAQVFDATPTQIRERTRRRHSNAPAPDIARASALTSIGTGITADSHTCSTPDGPASDASAQVNASAQGRTARSDSRINVRITLPVRDPFDAHSVFEFLAVRAIPGVESADLSDPDRLSYARTLSLPGGPGAVEVVASRLPRAVGSWRIEARLELSTLSDISVATARIRRLFDLDADAQGIDLALSADPALAPLVAQTPGIRVPGAVDPAELLIRAIIGQQISVAAARKHLTRLAHRAGEPYESSIPGLNLLFATPAAIAHAVPEPPAQGDLDPDRTLRLPRRSINTVRGAALALASGDLALHVGLDSADLRKRLVALPGVGEWTAAYVALRVLGDTDAWMIGDVALVAGARALGLLPNAINDDPAHPPAPPPSQRGKESAASKQAAHRALAERARGWAPWRSYASMHLWQAAGSPSTRPSPPARPSLPRNPVSHLDFPPANRDLGNTRGNSQPTSNRSTPEES